MINPTAIQEQQQQQPPIKNVVNRHVISRRNEVGVPPTPWMEAFELSDPGKFADQFFLNTYSSRHNGNYNF